MLLIDGYNLMYAAGIVGGGAGRGALERSRAALCRFVASALTDAERAGAVVVFDAAGAPPGLPATLDYAGVKVRFAKGYADADELLEELIAADTTPRRSTVVSSDHRVQRAARRRRAKAVDSDVWYETMLRKRRELSNPPADDASKPALAAGEAEIEFWLSRVIDHSDAGPAERQARDDMSGLGGIFPADYFDKDLEEE
jgi:predicted RNA-binding protein with PIN domain